MAARSACINAKKLNGIVRIEKLADCDEQVPFTKDAFYEALVRQHLGPDEFVLNLKGPELLSLNLNIQYRA
jgi:hypothetical protein